MPHLTFQPARFYLREQIKDPVTGEKKDRKGAPPVAVILLAKTDDGSFVRGIAIRSEADNFCRSQGLHKATDRIKEVLASPGSVASIRPIGWPVEGKNGSTEPRQAALRFIGAWHDRFGTPSPGFKGSKSPNLALTPYELKILQKAEERELGTPAKA